MSDVNAVAVDDAGTGAAVAKTKRPLSEKQKARVELNHLLKAQAQAGAKRRDIAHVMFAHDFTEAAVGTIMGYDPKTAAAAKADLSKAGRAKAEKLGVARVHHDFSKARLKEIDGHKVTARFFALAKIVLG